MGISTISDRNAPPTRYEIIESIRFPFLPSGERACQYAPDERFLVTYDDGTIHVVNAERVSWLIDMRDTIECGFKVEYIDTCGPNGCVCPVTEGPMERSEGDGFIYGSSPLLAGGQVVGHVEHTDH